MSDDTGFFLFIGAAVIVLICIVVFGMLSSRRKRNASSPTWTIRRAWIGDQPILETSDIALDDKRQEELFRDTYVIGGELRITVSDADGQPVERDVVVSRIARSLRADYLKAKLGLSVYFREWEGAEFPVSFAVKGTKGIRSVTLDAEGITALDANGATVWSCGWSALKFSNGPDMVLAGGTGGESGIVHLDQSDEHPELEEIIIKYGTLRQMHF